MFDNLLSVLVWDWANADTLASKDLAEASWDIVFSTILLSNDLAVASCDIINWDYISSILELGRDRGVGPLLCLVPKATSSSQGFFVNNISGYAKFPMTCFLDIYQKKLAIFYPKFFPVIFFKYNPKISHFHAEFLTFSSHLPQKQSLSSQF